MPQRVLTMAALFVGFSLLFTHCAVKTAPETLTNVGHAFDIPQMKTQSYTPGAGGSRGGCETSNALVRMQNSLATTRMMLCVLGAAENAHLVSRAQNGFNYYLYNAPNGAGAFTFRYGTLNGNLEVNACQNGNRAMEVQVAGHGGANQVTATQEWTWTPMNQRVMSHSVIQTDGEYKLVSQTMGMSGYGVSGSFGLAQGSPNRLYEGLTSTVWSGEVFAAYDGDQGASWVNGGAIESWQGTGYTCSSRNRYAAIAQAHDTTGLVASTSVQYLNRWDCTPPSGTQFTTLDVSDANVQSQMSACLAAGNLQQEETCTGTQSCP